ncbi:ASCH domain-containing protein [Aquimarina hainanensis]|uniref:ASCH domain-containing protein n=1 Tax=Aquimarina hainanensis TaxID=1578017 RepID=A0ABW5N6E9_9FLAO
MSKVIILSIKPEFSDQIFEGTKKIELRKSKPNVGKDDLVIIYNTIPDKAIVGICKITEIIQSTPDEIWNNYSNDLGIDKDRYFQYYFGRDKAVGLKIDSFRRFKKKISLDKIREFIPSFSPPQTFKYYNRDSLMGIFTLG